MIDLNNIEGMAKYIVEFLLSLPKWFMIEYQLTYYEPGTGIGSGLKNGFTMHCWVLSGDLLIEVYKQGFK